MPQTSDRGTYRSFRVMSAAAQRRWNVAIDVKGVDGSVEQRRARVVGLTTGEISADFSEICGASVSRETVSLITDRVLEEMQAWATRPLDEVYAAIFIDAVVVKIRDGQVGNQPLYAAIGVTVEGEREPREPQRPLPRAVRARGHFPTEVAALKCLYLVTRSLHPTGVGRTRWAMRWKPALNAFAITFADRFPAAETY